MLNFRPCFLRIAFSTFLFAFLFVSFSVHSQNVNENDSPNNLTDAFRQQLVDDAPHNLVGSYYTLENNTDAKLLLNNKGNTLLEVRPTLYDSQGRQQEIPPVTVEPQSFRFINLRDWAAIGGESFKSGNIKLFHYGKDLVLGAQIYLTDEARSLGFEEKLAEKSKFDSRRQEAGGCLQMKPKFKSS